jgi:Protein of unknown function (DUF3108)
VRLALFPILLGLLGFAAGSAAASDAKEVHLSYYGYLGDIQIGQLEVSFRLPPDGVLAMPYNVRADLTLAGAYGQLLPFRWQGEAEGGTGQYGVKPSRYQSYMNLLGTSEALTMTYRPNGAVEVVSEPPTVESNRAAAQGLGNDTVDPLSAAVAIVDAMIRNGNCGTALPVFDGARRFDLRVSPAGQDVVERTYFSTYEGPAERCRVDVDLIAGFQPDATSSGFYPSETDVWLASVMDKAPPVPVRVLAHSRAGLMRIDLIEVRTLAAAVP